MGADRGKLDRPEPRRGGDGLRIGCDDHIRCGQHAVFRYTFDPGPGESTTFAAPTATLTTPGRHGADCSTSRAPGPDALDRSRQPYDGPKQVDGAQRHAFALPETAGGTVLCDQGLLHRDDASPVLRGDRRAHQRRADRLGLDACGDAPVQSFDDPDHNLVNGVWQNGSPGTLSDSQVYYEWISPQFRAAQRRGPDRSRARRRTRTTTSSTRRPPASASSSRRTRRTARSRSSLYAPGRADSRRSASRAPGACAGHAGDRAERRRAGSRRESGADAGAELAGQTLVDQAVVGGDGTARGRGRVDGYRRRRSRCSCGSRAATAQPSSALVLAARRSTWTSRPRSRCTAVRAGVQTDDPGPIGASDPVDGRHQHRLPLRPAALRRHATARRRPSDVRDALGALTGDRPRRRRHGAGRRARRSTRTPRSQAARTALDANPCSMSARRSADRRDQRVRRRRARRRTATRSRRSSSSAATTSSRFAPVAQHTSQFTEASHAADLRLRARPAGGACPELAPTASDPCATPLSAAAATSHILTDDPYGLATGVRVARRLPLRADGRARPARRQPRPDPRARSTASSPPTACSRPTRRSPAATARGASSRQVTAGARLALGAPNAATLDGSAGSPTISRPALFPATATSARVVSINTHADETRMLPGVPGAESGQLRRHRSVPRRRSRETPRSSAGALIFVIGCHAGNNLPTRVLRRRDRLGRRLLRGRRLRRQHRLRPREQRHDRAQRAAARASTPTGSASRWTGDAGLGGRRAHVREAVLPRRPRPVLGLRREGAHGGGVLRPADVHLRRPATKAAPLPDDARSHRRHGRRADLRGAELLPDVRRRRTARTRTARRWSTSPRTARHPRPRPASRSSPAS